MIRIATICAAALAVMLGICAAAPASTRMNTALARFGATADDVAKIHFATRTEACESSRIVDLDGLVDHLHRMVDTFPTINSKLGADAEKQFFLQSLARFEKVAAGNGDDNMYCLALDSLDKVMDTIRVLIYTYEPSEVSIDSRVVVKQLIAAESKEELALVANGLSAHHGERIRSAAMRAATAASAKAAKSAGSAAGAAGADIAAAPLPSLETAMRAKKNWPNPECTECSFNAHTAFYWGFTSDPAICPGPWASTFGQCKTALRTANGTNWATNDCNAFLASHMDCQNKFGPQGSGCTSLTKLINELKEEVDYWFNGATAQISAAGWELYAEYGDEYWITNAGRFHIACGYVCDLTSVFMTYLETVPGYDHQQYACA
mmetsp:Transcript_14425/g.38620  ORF Transcript_14425/g.38620 Transcript_14425/m.38620 type:complete len:378 (-) Transcript_14425:315-1448(-)